LNEKPISSPTLLRYLRNIFGVSEINNDIMRSSYIKWFYSTERTMNDKEKLSHQMRHSVETAQRNYLKVNTENNCDELKDKVTELQFENKTISDKINNENINSKLYNKRKRDVLFQLNKYNRVVRETTLKKYNIHFDKGLNKYI